MASETATPTSATLIQDAQSKMITLTTALTNANASLTALGITNITPSPTLATTNASILAQSV